MYKYFIRYLVFWAPAILSAYLLTPQSTTLLQVVQWFCGFVMLFGWAMTTSTVTYNYPRQALTFILVYCGVNALLITLLEGAPFGSVRYTILDHTAGAFSYRPLYMLYESLLESSTFREMWIAGVVAGACVAGFIWGMFYRQIKPDPYRPTFIR